MRRPGGKLPRLPLQVGKLFLPLHPGSAGTGRERLKGRRLKSGLRGFQGGLAGKKLRKKPAGKLAVSEKLLTFASRFRKGAGGGQRRESPSKKKIEENSCKEKSSAYLCSPLRREARRAEKREKKVEKKFWKVRKDFRALHPANERAARKGIKKETGTAGCLQAKREALRQVL